MSCKKLEITSDHFSARDPAPVHFARASRLLQIPSIGLSIVGKLYKALHLPRTETSAMLTDFFASDAARNLRENAPRFTLAQLADITGIAALSMLYVDRETEGVILSQTQLPDGAPVSVSFYYIPADTRLSTRFAGASNAYAGFALAARLHECAESLSLRWSQDADIFYVFREVADGHFAFDPHTSEYAPDAQAYMESLFGVNLPAPLLRAPGP